MPLGANEAHGDRGAEKKHPMKNYGVNVAQQPQDLGTKKRPQAAKTSQKTVCSCHAQNTGMEQSTARRRAPALRDSHHEAPDGKNPILLVEVPEARLKAAEDEAEQEARPLDEDQLLRANLHEHLRHSRTTARLNMDKPRGFRPSPKNARDRRQGGLSIPSTVAKEQGTLTTPRPRPGNHGTPFKIDQSGWWRDLILQVFRHSYGGFERSPGS